MIDAELQQYINKLVDDSIEQWWGSIPRYKDSADNEVCTPKRFVEKYIDKIRDIYSKWPELNNEIEKLKKEIEQLKKQPPILQQSLTVNNQQNNSSSSIDKTVEAFNAWAKNPESHLPLLFNYAEGDLKLREKQKIKNTSPNNATWIINKSGSTKYLFPNPTAIDQISGKIDALYTVTGTRKARGHNKVIIQKACVIKEDGWIEYKGELSLL